MSMEYRLRRTLPADRAAIIMPVDHGLIFNRISGLETPSASFAAWGNNGVTGFMMTPGQVKQTEGFFAENPHLSRVLTIFPWNLSRQERAAMCTRVGQVVTACDQWDIPLVLEPVIMGAPRTEEVIVEEEKVARIAYDLGAHIIKIAFPGEERTRRLVDELQVPLVIAGGPLAGEPAETVDAIAQTIRAGARGVIVGRNIWQRERAQAEDVLSQVSVLTREASFAI